MQELQTRSRHHLTIITHEHDLGVTVAYNQAIAVVKTPFVLQLNPDVDFSTECITDLLNILRINKHKT